MDFLAENNHCGQTLLKLIARGNSTIAELLRLKDVVPSVYKNPSRFEQQKYGELVTLEFGYFGGRFSDQVEKRLDESESLKSADEELKETHLELLSRFYRLFEGVHRYVNDLLRYLQDLEEGLYIQQSVESVFLDEDGKQLLCESLYIYGAMLLLLDIHLEGPVRERLLVAYYRYSGQHSEGSNIDDICQLLRSTGYCSVQTKRVVNYPELYFSRIKIPEHFVRMVIGSLRSDDIYNQVRCYPNPDHRWTALAEQAAMLYVSLFFAPSVLKSETATMREIADKFFPDNWVISIYMGTTVNLVESWEPYKAAKAALSNTTQTLNVKQIAVRNAAKLQRLLPDTKKLLQEGALTEENVLDSAVKVMNVARECNVTLRWTMLHTTPLSNSGEQHKKCRQLRDQVLSEMKYKQEDLFQLLLNTSEFEFKLKTMYKKMLNRRHSYWDKCRVEAVGRMTNLAIMYEEDKAQKNVKLRDWFRAREVQMGQLSLDDALFSGNLARQLLDALSEAQDFDQLEANWAVKQHVEEAKRLLRQMIRTAGLKDDILVSLQIVGDLSYAWEIVDTFTTEMQQGVKKDPALVGKLRATFLKLASALERPVLRISQAKSRDLVSVSQYYSAELVSYVRKVLQIIPESMFRLLDQIIRLQTDRIKEVPTRLDKDKLKDYAQLQERYEVARLTHAISVFTEGMLAMKSTLYGVIKVDPKQLLEDGIRKEIVRQVSLALHHGLIFNPKAKSSELPSKLASLSKTMSGFRKSFEYIQDYVNISGLKMWQEEVSRIINFNVEQESNLFLKQKIPLWSSMYQNKNIPIPLHQLSGSSDNTLTFMGRLANELISVTSPKSTIFVPARQTWYDSRTQEETTSLTKLFPLLEAAVGTFGLAGLDRLFGLKIVTLLHNIVQLMETNVFRDKSWIDMLDNLANSLNPVENVIAQPMKFYHQQHLSRATRALMTLMESIVDLGQLQLLRKQIAYKLSTGASFDAKLLHSSVKTFNQYMLSHLQKKPNNEGESLLLYEFSSYLHWGGLTDPNLQVYVTAKPGPKLTELLFLAIIGNLGKGVYSPSTGGIMAKRAQDHLDGYPFVLGITCLLRQYPKRISDRVIQYMAQYTRSFVAEQTSTSKVQDTPLEVVNALVFMEMLTDEQQESKNVMFHQLPGPVVDLASKTPI